MEKKNLLFICTENRHRSVTAEKMFENNVKYNAKSAGISPIAQIKVTKKALDWADLIFVMESFHEKYVLEKFPKFSSKQIINLDISDKFRRNDPQLKKLLKKRLSKFLDIQ